MGTTKELIKDFVTNRYMDDAGETRQSCLMMALQNARILSGRDIETGKPKAKDDTVGYELPQSADGVPPENCAYPPDFLESVRLKNNLYSTSDNFGGLIHYLLLLDLIGTVFRAKNDAIYNTLRDFSPITDDKERRAIYALRCCLVHNYGLINNGKKEKQHKFTLLLNDETDGTKDMIDIPEPRWDGVYTNKDESMSTKINVCKLIDAIEGTYQNLKSKAEEGKLDLCLDGGVDELRARFTVKS